MDDQPSIDEPVVDRWIDGADRPRKRKRPALHPGIFSLSGGVMRDKSGSGNRIDYLLAKMLERPDSLYIPNIDRNLDCLLTSLQLDMVKPNHQPMTPNRSEEKIKETDG